MSVTGPVGAASQQLAADVVGAVAASTRAQSARACDDAPQTEPSDDDPDPDELDIDDRPTGEDAYWDAFIPDEDECDPLPEPGDFWLDDDEEFSVSPEDR